MILGFFEHITFTEHHHLSSTSDRQALDACKECATETPRMCRSQWSLLFCENSAADLPGGRVQVVIQAVGNGCEHRWGLAQSATTYLLPCSPVPTRPQAGARVSGPFATGWIAGGRRGTTLGLGDQWEHYSSCRPEMSDRVKWKWKSLSHVQLFVTPWTTQSLEFSVRILERVAFPFSRGSSQPRARTEVSRIAGGFSAAEPPGKPGAAYGTAAATSVKGGGAGSGPRWRPGVPLFSEGTAGRLRGKWRPGKWGAGGSGWDESLQCAPHMLAVRFSMVPRWRCPGGAGPQGPELRGESR